MKNQTSTNRYRGAFALMTTLFFIWGAIVSLNDILIPHFKGLFNMNYTETMLIQFCFFGAYFLMAVPASLLIERIGYKKGISAGLLTIGLGALLFLPASWTVSYPLFLFGLFTMATGSVILQVVANPYVIILGKPETASSRLNLAQGINSLATTLAPLAGGFLILGHYNTSKEAAAAVEGPYLGLAIFAFLIAVVFFFLKLPKVLETDGVKVRGNVLKFRQLRLGAIALMLYVGAEVAIGSFIVNFLGEPNIAGLAEKEAATYIPLYWGGLMIGRFLGSAILQKASAQKVLCVSALASVLLLAVTILTNGYVAMWAMLVVGLFNSIMWSNIFTLAVNGLGKYTNKASGILVMAPVGGALLPLLQGVLADMPAIGLHLSYILPLSCYAFIIYYAVNGHKPGANELAQVEAGH
ncbi:sugar MFS transporter [Pseudozobellia thermophila]|uniref:MFS transporter, FHS family, L-fucose permease n=1 Tax=Pseudozobellia thermophila TaxID=192903 RepID=A0A1M6I456_9FLAO|nr:sugar MFS transporter [Pseudozobellia thermophila]SHJ29251.1 MFS transporter, FHS family, L-fucose permease [Pseudozobellia thermophila]